MLVHQTRLDVRPSDASPAGMLCHCLQLVYATVPLNQALSSFVPMFHLLDVCVSGYCPSTWEAREMWYQRFAFTTFPDAALEIERVMHLFPVLRPHNVSSKSGSRVTLSYKCVERVLIQAIVST